MSEPGIVREAEQLLESRTRPAPRRMVSDLLAEVRRLEAERDQKCDHGETTVCWRCVNAEKVKAYQRLVEQAESSLSTLQANFQETHTAWNRENDARHDAEDRLSTLVAGVQQLEQEMRSDASFNPRETSPGYRHGLEKCAEALTALRIAATGGEK